MRWKTILVIALVLILISSCVKIGRYSIQLISPKNGENDVSLRPTFLWSFKSAFPVNVTYDFYLSSGEEFGDPIAKDLKGMSFSPDKSLEPGREYRWKVVAKTPAGYVSSEVWSFKTVENRPPNKPSLSSPPNGSTVGIDVTFSWSCSDPDGDRITFKLILSNHTDLSSPVVVDGINSPSAKLTLSPNSTYYWKVVAYDERGLSSESEVWEFKTKGFPPVKPKLLYPKPGEKSVPLLPTLSWFSYDPDGSSVVYDVLFGNSETSLSTILENSTRSSYRLSRKLSMNTTYYWKVVARDSEGNTSESDLGYFTTLYVKNDPPTTPTILSPKSGTTGLSFVGVTLSWSPSTDPEGKEVTYDVYLGNDKTAVEDRSLETLIAEDLKDTQYTIKGTLKPGTTYYWLVMAKDGFNETPSELASFTTMGAVEIRNLLVEDPLSGVWLFKSESGDLKGELILRSCANRGMALKGNFLYVSCGGRSDEMYIYDISDLQNPVLLKKKDTLVAYQAKVFGNYLVYYGDVLRIYDISDPSNPSMIYNWDMGCCKISSVDSDGEYLYLSEYWEDEGRKFYRILRMDLKSRGMEILKQESNVDLKYTGVAVYNDKLYVLRTDWGRSTSIQIYDLSNLDTPVDEVTVSSDYYDRLYRADDKLLIGNFWSDNYYIYDTYSEEVRGPFEGFTPRDGIKLNNGYAIAGERYGLRILDKDLNTIYFYDIHSYLSDMGIYKGYILAVDESENRMIVYDSDLNEIGSYDFYDYMIAIASNVMYTNSGKVYDISDPLHPKLLGGSFITYDVRYMKTVGNRFYVLNRNSLEIYDISSPELPKQLSSLPLDFDAEEIVVEGNTVAIRGWEKVIFVDVSDGKKPRIMSSWNNSPRGMASSKGYIYVFVDDNGRKLLVFDAKDVKLISTVNADICYDLQEISVYGNYMIVPSNCGYLAIFDISDPKKPKLVNDDYRINAIEIEVIQRVSEDGYIYLGIKNHGILKIDASKLPDVDVISTADWFYTNQVTVVGE